MAANLDKRQLDYEWVLSARKTRGNGKPKAKEKKEEEERVMYLIFILRAFAILFDYRHRFSSNTMKSESK